jgi:hypothetical protein
MLHRLLSHVITTLVCGVALSAAIEHQHYASLSIHTSDGRNVSPDLFWELEEMARIVDIAYCVGSGAWGISKPFKCLYRCDEFPEFELIKTWTTGILLSDSCGYLALDHGKKRILLVFRGTYSVTNALVDLTTVPQEWDPYPGNRTNEPKCEKCFVHRGFQQSWDNTRDEVTPEVEAARKQYSDYQLHMIGHSLGGAVAALGSLDYAARGWDPIVTTFGEPRTGNKGLMQYMDWRFNLTKATEEVDHLKFRRLTHIDDPIPQVPPTEFGFAMHAGEIHISKASLPPEMEDVQHCEGDVDPTCIAGQDPTAGGDQSWKHGLRDHFAIPAKYKLWNIMTAHRDYFWRLGICAPGGDPFGGGHGYDRPPEQKVLGGNGMMRE